MRLAALTRWHRAAALAVSLTASVSISLGTAPADAGALPRETGCQRSHWVGSFSAAPSDASAGFDASLDRLSFGADQTFRMIVVPHLGGSVIRLRLSNAFGAHPVTFSAVTVADRGAGSAIKPGSVHTVSFAGRSSVTVAAGADTVSDPVRFAVRPFTDVAVSVFVHAADLAPTEHFTARQTSYVTAVGAGDHVRSVAGGAFTQRTTADYYVAGLDVDAAASAGAVVAFGDSITDGYQSPNGQLPESRATIGTNQRYPDFLQRRLDRAGIPLSTLEAGISGNRLLQGGYIAEFGPSGLSRFQRDALRLPGVTDVIVLEGINDIGLTPGITAGELIAGDRRLIAAAHRAGVRIQLGTLTPAGTSVQPTYRAAAANELREQVYAWIRRQRLSDGIVDFDAAVRDPADPAEIAPRYNGGDGLHLDPAGYRAMAAAVNLRALARPACATRRG